MRQESVEISYDGGENQRLLTKGDEGAKIWGRQSLKDNSHQSWKHAWDDGILKIKDFVVFWNCLPPWSGEGKMRSALVR